MRKNEPCTRFFFKCEEIHFCSSANCSTQENLKRVSCSLALFEMHGSEHLIMTGWLTRIRLWLWCSGTALCFAVYPKPNLCASSNNVHSGWITQHEKIQHFRPTMTDVCPFYPLFHFPSQRSAKRFLSVPCNTYYVLINSRFKATFSWDYYARQGCHWTRFSFKNQSYFE